MQARGMVGDANDVPSDGELLASVRAGDSDAYGVLFERHFASALAVAKRHAGNHSDASDLAAEAFAKVFATVRAGGGPEVFFRAYVYSTIRRLAAAQRTKDGRQLLSDEMDSFVSESSDKDTLLAAFEAGTVAKSFESLPERWRAVLWYMEIEGMAPAAVSPLLGLAPNAVSALAVRAREGLRQAYLQNHLRETAGGGCAGYSADLGAYARSGLSPRKRARMREHLDGCAQCTMMLVHLRDVGSSMRGVIFPLYAGFALSGTALVHSGGGLALGTGVRWFLGRSKDIVGQHVVASAAVAIASVATVGVAAALAVSGAGGGPSTAEPGSGIDTQTPAAPPASIPSSPVVPVQSPPADVAGTAPAAPGIPEPAWAVPVDAAPGPVAGVGRFPGVGPAAPATVWPTAPIAKPSIRPTVPPIKPPTVPPVEPTAAPTEPTTPTVPTTAPPVSPPAGTVLAMAAAVVEPVSPFHTTLVLGFTASGTDPLGGMGVSFRAGMLGTVAPDDVQAPAGWQCSAGAAPGGTEVFCTTVDADRDNLQFTVTVRGPNAFGGYVDVRASGPGIEAFTGRADF